MGLWWLSGSVAVEWECVGGVEVWWCLLWLCGYMGDR